MSQEPKVTRFGADPTVDQELATKAYVDSSGGGGGRAFLGSYGINTSHAGNANVFATWSSWAFTSMSGSATESKMITAIGWAITIKRIYCVSDTNTKNGVTIQGVRDDGVTSSSLTIAASTTGNFDSGDLTDEIASGSEVCWIFDPTASSSGSFGNFGTSFWGFET